MWAHMKSSFLFLVVLAVLVPIEGFVPSTSSFVSRGNRRDSKIRSFAAPAAEKETTLGNDATTKDLSVEDTTKKFGLEAGLFESLKKEDGGESAKSLLKKYGIAYLATSIPLAMVSFSLCYVLVDNGVDVGALLARVGIESAASEKAGTFGLAYAFHKAASPIRFPPTVVLTPVVAKLIGKEPEVDESEDNSSIA